MKYMTEIHHLIATSPFKALDEHTMNVLNTSIYTILH